MQRKPRSSEELVEDIIGLTVTVRKSTTDHMHANILIEFGSCHGQVLEVLDHLEARVGHTSLELFVAENLFAVTTLCVSPGEDRGDDYEGLLLGLMVVEGLSQDLNNSFSFVKICSTEKINNDTVGTDQALAEGLGLALSIKNFDLLVRRRHNICVTPNHCSRELV